MIPTDPPARSVPDPGWTPSRVLALAAGALILIWITKRTVGIALVPLLGILIAVKVQRSRGRRLTRFGAWFVATAAATLGLTAVVGFGFSRLPAGFLSKTMDSVIAVQKHAPPPALPPVFEKMRSDDSASRAAQARAQEMVQNPAFIGWMMAIGVAIGCGILGLTLGTITWGGAMLLTRGFMGDWPFRKDPEPAV